MTLEMKREKITEMLVEVSLGVGIQDELTSDDVEAICRSMDEAKFVCCREEDLLLIAFLHLDRIYRDKDYAEEVKVDKFEQIGVMLDYMRGSLLKQMGR